jgi:hypothetical protein
LGKQRFLNDHFERASQGRSNQLMDVVVVHLPLDCGRQRLQTASREAVPSFWGKILWLPQVLRPNLSILSRSPQNGTAVSRLGGEGALDSRGNGILNQMLPDNDDDHDLPY